MKKRMWESQLRNELRDNLFMPRLNRITLLLKGKKPKKLSGKQKGNLKGNLTPIIVKALRDTHKKELISKFVKSFKLPEKSVAKKRKKIAEKIKRYDKKLKKFIYTLWKDRNTCLYVGQTRRGKGEIISKSPSLLKRSKLLKIYEVRSKKHLDKYEGIACHIFAPKGKESPKYNKVHPSKAFKKCPFCKMKKKVDKEIENAFVIVRKKKRARPAKNTA